MEEVWRDIPGYENKYQASTMGRIKSLKRLVRGENPYTKEEFFRRVPERILRPGQYCKAGHVSVTLGRGTAGIPVHQLIAVTFIGPCPSGMEVMHINGDPTDNRVVNLSYGTRTSNIIDVYMQGGRWRKLSIDEVIEIRRRLDKGDKGSILADEFSVSQSTISSIKRRVSFGWLPENMSF